MFLKLCTQVLFLNEQNNDMKILPKESQKRSQWPNTSYHLCSNLGPAFLKTKDCSSFLFSKLFRQQKSWQLLPGREKVL